MGGPALPEETGSFLKRLFCDQDIIDLGGGAFQNAIGQYVSKRRTPKVQAQYEQIGGSPILKWTNLQGEEMCKILDKVSPQTAPHKAYTGFRYVTPLTEEALTNMANDNVEHAIAFSQYPHWSCTTAGSSMNNLWRELERLDMTKKFKWSIIDRWPLHQGFMEAVQERIYDQLMKYDEKDRDDVIIVFSAHSIPMKTVAKGDSYTGEIASSVDSIMNLWNKNYVGKKSGVRKANPYILAWQSKVGYLPWMVPHTSDVIQSLGKKGHKNVLVVPIAFTSDHIETLFEIGIEYAEEAHKLGITGFRFTEGLNDSKTFIQGIADIVSEHLKAKKNHSSQYPLKCIGCEKPYCKRILNPAY